MEPVGSIAVCGVLPVLVEEVGIETLDQFDDLIKEIEDNVTTMSYPISQNVGKLERFAVFCYRSSPRDGVSDYRNLSIVQLYLIRIGNLCRKIGFDVPAQIEELLAIINLEIEEFLARLDVNPEFLNLPESIIKSVVCEIVSLDVLPIEEVLLEKLALIQAAVLRYLLSIEGYEEKARGYLRNGFDLFVRSNLECLYRKITDNSLPSSLEELRERTVSEGKLDRIHLRLYEITKSLLALVKGELFEITLCDQIEALYYNISRGVLPSPEEFEVAIPYLRDLLEVLPGDPVTAKRKLIILINFFQKHMERRSRFPFEPSEALNSFALVLSSRLEEFEEITCPEDALLRHLQTIKSVLPNLSDVTLVSIKGERRPTPMCLPEFEVQVLPILKDIATDFDEFKRRLEGHSPIERSQLIINLRNVVFVNVCMIYEKWTGQAFALNIFQFKDQITGFFKGPFYKNDCEAHKLAFLFLYPLFHTLK